MPIFSYTAIDAQGQVSRSTIVAASPSEAAAGLTARGMTPMSIAESEGGASFTQVLQRIGFVRLREVVLFLRMLSSLIGSGITITESISVLHDQTVNRRFKSILGEIRDQIEGGISLSDAMSAHPRVFPQTAVSMVRAGELGGILEDVLITLVTYMEKRAALKKMIIRSFLYPAIVLVVAIGVVVFLVTFVIPRFLVLLKGSKLPWNTQLLLDVSGFMIDNKEGIVIAVLGGAAGLTAVFFIRETRNVIDRYKMDLPLFGPIFRFGVIVQFSRTLASLLQSGIPLVEGLKSTGATLTNQAVKNSIDEMVEKVVAGEQLSSVLAKMDLFTSLTTSMFRIGEQSGNMDESVNLVADIYEQQLEDRINWMSSLVEPTLIISLGVIVGFVAWGLIAGMLALYTRAA